MKTVSRREFIKLSLSGATVFALGIRLAQPDSALSAEAREGDSFSPDLWLQIDQQNICQVTVPETEMGQGVYTGLATLVAEELDHDWNLVRVKRASSAEKYGYQSTGGSTSLRNAWSEFRQVGAIARQVFLQAAAGRWKVPVSRCFTESGHVYLKDTQRRFRYADLIADANRIRLPDQVELKNPQDFRLAAKALPRLDVLEKISGKALFGIDVQLPDMLIATTVHPPVFGAKITGFDDRAARRVDNIIDIFQIENAVAVVARDFWSASQAARALKIDWQAAADLSDDASIQQQLKNALAGDGIVVSQKGEPGKKNKQSIKAEYSVPLQAHATLEPMNCTVHIHDGMCEIWAPTQSPSAAKSIAEDYYFSFTDRAWKKIKSILHSDSQDGVVVHTTYAGGGFGRRLKQDFVAEAVQIARHFSQPVKLIWSRQEDMQHDCYRPMARCSLQAETGKDGYPESLIHHIASPSIRESLDPGYLERKQGVDSSALEGAKYLPYEIDNHKLIYSHIRQPVPLGYWRSVGASINAFCIESFIDELANRAGIDPLEYRLELLQFNSRLLNTLQRVARLSAWKQDEDAFYGIACHSSYDSHVSQVAKIIRQADGLRLSHVYTVIDCGLYVNPDIIRAQLEGAVIYGLSALFSEINIQQGRVKQSNFHDFPLLRYARTPDIRCEIIHSQEAPGGVGEPGVPTVIPAVCNAIYSATGQRIRDLPVKAEIFAG